MKILYTLWGAFQTALWFVILNNLNDYLTKPISEQVFILSAIIAVSWMVAICGTGAILVFFIKEIKIHWKEKI